MSSGSENWDDYERVYKPIYQTMMHQLKHSTPRNATQRNAMHDRSNSLRIFFWADYGPGLAAGVDSGTTQAARVPAAACSRLTTSGARASSRW